MFCLSLLSIFPLWSQSWSWIRLSSSFSIHFVIMKTWHLHLCWLLCLHHLQRHCHHHNHNTFMETILIVFGCVDMCIQKVTTKLYQKIRLRLLLLYCMLFVLSSLLSSLSLSQSLLLYRGSCGRSYCHCHCHYQLVVDIMVAIIIAVIVVLFLFFSIYPLLWFILSPSSPYYLVFIMQNIFLLCYVHLVIFSCCPLRFQSPSLYHVNYLLGLVLSQIWCGPIHIAALLLLIELSIISFVYI